MAEVMGGKLTADVRLVDAILWRLSTFFFPLCCVGTRIVHVIHSSHFDFSPSPSPPTPLYGVQTRWDTQAWICHATRLPANLPPQTLYCCVSLVWRLQSSLVVTTSAQHSSVFTLHTPTLRRPMVGMLSSWSSLQTEMLLAAPFLCFCAISLWSMGDMRSVNVPQCRPRNVRHSLPLIVIGH